MLPLIYGISDEEGKSQSFFATIIQKKIGLTKSIKCSRSLRSEIGGSLPI